MAYRTPAQVKDEFQAHPRRALIVTTVVSESRSVKAFLTDPAVVVGEKGAYYEYGRFSEPAGDWLIVRKRGLKAPLRRSRDLSTIR